MSTITELLAAIPPEPDPNLSWPKYVARERLRRQVQLRVAYEALSLYGVHQNLSCLNTTEGKRICACGLHDALAAINPLAAGTAREAGNG